MRLEENDILELDRLRIWDFYLLFPSKVYEIRLGNDFKEIVKLRKIGFFIVNEKQKNFFMDFFFVVFWKGFWINNIF